MLSKIKRSVVRPFEIGRIVAQSAIAEMRHLFTRYRRGPRLRVWDVDVVYLWCDPSDPDWAARRGQVLERARHPEEYCRITAQTATQREPLDELLFSLRSVDRHLRGVRNIYVVVDRQLPAWLKADHPQLRVVQVEDIIDDPAHYPNYNTQAIESYFYNLPGLSERFIYFNDDFFLRRQMGVDEFFTSDGKIKVRLGRALSPKGAPSPDEEGDYVGHKNANRLLDESFGRRARLTVMHRPYAHTLSLLRSAATRFPQAFEDTRASRFRSTRMFALHSFLVSYFAYHSRDGDLVPPKLWEKDMFLWGRSAEENAEVARRIGGMKGKAFCIQEERGVALPSAEAEHFHRFMSELYPEASQYEIGCET